MPLDHQGALSGVTYKIPALADVRDPSKAFADFADSIPALPPIPAVLAVETITGDKTAAVNHLYLYEGATPVAVTLPASGAAGDKVCVYQLGTGAITVNGIAVGTPTTSARYSAVTAVWDGARWVGTPFSFSGTRPAESIGGTITDLNGFRYHAFTTPGVYTFISHKALAVEVVVVGAGGGGETSAVGTAGPAGQGGTVEQQPIAIGDWTFTTVRVGAGGDVTVDGQASSFGTVAAAGGKGGKQGATTPPSTPTLLTGDWATVAGVSSVGGPGGSGPAAPATPGIGGGGGYDLLPSYPQETETYTYTTGGPYTYDCSYGARAEQYQSGTQRVVGDPCVNGQCPGGWRCETVGYIPPMGADMRCVTDVPTYSTRYVCDSGGTLSGTTCVRTCQGDNTQVHTGTRPKACNAGYTANSGQCVDSRPVGGGKGGPGLVLARYALP